jgi:hypothetical protein
VVDLDLLPVFSDKSASRSTTRCRDGPAMFAGFWPRTANPSREGIDSMKRILAVAFILCYISVLTFGNACHLLRHGVGSHPLMYMIVWDMFCGWAAYDSRMRIIAEGESETYYDLTHPPWGELHAFGYIGRENYDQYNTHSGDVALNVLKHSSHEPIARIIVIEESWPKKLNLPDPVWNLRYDIPKDRHTYYRIRQVMLPDGTITQRYDSFLSFHARQLAGDNPRLVQQSKATRPMFLNDGAPSLGRDALLGPPSAAIPVSAPSAH